MKKTLKVIMRRDLFLLIALVVLMLAACKKKDITPDNQNKDTEVEKVKDDFDFSLGFKEKSMINSFIVGKVNYVWFNINIKDTAPEKNMVYILRPIGKEPSKHQKFKEDYTFHKGYIPIVDKGMGVYWGSIDEAIITNNTLKNYCFGVLPKNPGTFQLYFEMQKYDTVQKKNIGKSVVKPIAFSAVEIKFYTLTRNNPEKPKFRQRFYLFSIFDGDKANDKYLSNYDEVQGYTYKTSQPDGGGFTGVFSASKKKLINRMEFRHNDEQKKYDPPINHRERINIKIIKHLKNNNTVEIEYKNVWITEIETINP